MSAATTASYRGALRHRDFRWLLAGLSVSSAGDWLYNIALVVYVFDQTQSTGWVAAASVARLAPYVLLSAYGGVIADRFERTLVMIGSDLVRALLMLGMGLVAALNGPAVLVVALAVAVTASTTPYLPAATAMTPSVVGEQDLAAANTITGFVENVSIIVGPVIGAAILVVGDPATAFVLNALTFLVSAICVSQVRRRSAPGGSTQEEASTRQRMREGVAAVSSSSSVALLVAFGVVVSLLYGTDTVLFVMLAEERMGTGPEGYGYLLAALGLGGVLAVTITNRLAASPRLVTVLAVSTAMYCLPTAALVLVHDLPGTFALQVVRGVAVMVVEVLSITALQRAVSPEVMARVFGITATLEVSGLLLGVVLVPPLISLLGLDGALLVLGLAVPVLLLAVAVPVRRLDARGAARARELAPRLRVLEGLGIFTATSQPVLERLAAAAVEQRAEPQTMVVREGAPARAFYAVVSGQLAVSSRGQSGGRRRALGHLGPGDYFGEIGLLEGIPRTATVEAVDDCVLLRLDGEEFVGALVDSAAAAPSLYDRMAGRLARTHPSRPLRSRYVSAR